MHAFNTLFLTITVNLKLHQVGRDDAISFLKDTFTRDFPGINITPTTQIQKLVRLCWNNKILKACLSLVTLNPHL
jgi:hypothetical protein